MVCYHVHNSPPLAFFLNQMNIIHTDTLIKIHLNILLPYRKVSELNVCMHFSSFPCMLHAMTTIPSLIYLKVETVQSSQTMESKHINTRRHNPEARDFNITLRKRTTKKQLYGIKTGLECGVV